MKREKRSYYSLSLFQLLWDAWCIGSIIGIWPRFIEPRLLSRTKLTLEIPDLPEELSGLKILQFSDLHLHPFSPRRPLKKLVQAAKKFNPDLITLTGDFLCLSKMNCPVELEEFLQNFSAPMGCYAVLGNHDYTQSLSINEEGNYDVMRDTGGHLLKKGFHRLFHPVEIKDPSISTEAKELLIHPELETILAKTSFKLLHNETVQTSKQGKRINICGLGEHMAGKCTPKIAYQNYDTSAPGIVLLHNPDGIPSLEHWPGDVILSGHTHGSQINLPFIRDQITMMEHPEYRRGLFSLQDRFAYVNRGLGACLNFRWFSTPEVLLLTLKRKKP